MAARKSCAIGCRNGSLSQIRCWCPTRCRYPSDCRQAQASEWLIATKGMSQKRRTWVRLGCRIITNSGVWMMERERRRAFSVLCRCRAVNPKWGVVLPPRGDRNDPWAPLRFLLLYKLPLLPPLARHRPRQLLQLHPLRLPPLKNHLFDIRRQQGEPQQPVDEAVSAISAVMASISAMRRSRRLLSGTVAAPVHSSASPTALKYNSPASCSSKQARTAGLGRGAQQLRDDVRVEDDPSVALVKAGRLARGNIPAGAGEPFMRRGSDPSVRVYSRGRGGTSTAITIAIAEVSTGLSPRVRGNLAPRVNRKPVTAAACGPSRRRHLQAHTSPRFPRS
jgi:hypothetical protein